MRAVVMTAFGPPEVLVPDVVPDPVAGVGEVVVDVGYANVTFVETQVRAGKPPNPAMLPDLPAILGNGVGGTVRSGPPDLTGRTVVAGLGGSGGYAERAVAAEARLIEVPAGVPLRDAVALLADGRTALSLLDLARIQPGETIVVEAAAGGVGTLLVQLAHNAGARIVALAGGARKLAVARQLGADVTIDYGTDGWTDQVRDTVGRVDVVFDGVGGSLGLGAFGLLGAGGRFCPFGMASGSFAPVPADLAAAADVAVLRGGPPSAQALTELSRRALAEAAAGRLRPIIGQEVPLERAAAAHAAIEARATIGKTLLGVSRRRTGRARF